MAEDTPQPKIRRKKKRRPPPKKAWHEQPWVLPGILGACGLLLVVVGVVWWTQRTPKDPVDVAQTSNEQIQESVRDFYQGDYTLLDQTTLQEKKLLPDGIKMRPDANQMVSQWGPVEIMGSNATGTTQPPYDHFIIVYSNIPQQACPALAAKMMAQYPKVWIGQSPPKAVEAEVAANAAQAEAFCKKSPTVSIMGLGK